MWFNGITLSLFSLTCLVGAQVVQNGKCCKADINLSVKGAEPKFQGFCWKISTFGNSGVQYKCGDYGYVKYRPGIEEKHTGVTHNAEFELVKAQGGPGYVHIILRCAPEDNKGLKKSFIVAGHPFFCQSTIGRTWGGLDSCKHPRISYRLAPQQVGCLD